VVTVAATRSWLRGLSLAVPLCVAYALILYLYDPAGPSALLRIPHWDGNHYLSIASEGYYLRPCGQELERIGWTICGNPWFPGWPYWNRLIATIFQLHISDSFAYSAAGFGLLAIAATAACSFLLVNPSELRIQHVSRVAPALCALIALLQPAGFQLFTHFPYAFVLTLSWAYLYVLYGTADGAGRWRILAPLAAAISLAYPTAALVSVFPAGSAFKSSSSATFPDRAPAAFSARIWRSIASGLPFLTGFVVIGAIFYVNFHDVWLFFRHAQQFRQDAGILQLGWTTDGLERRQLAVMAWYAGAIVLFWSRGLFRIETIAYLLIVSAISLVSGTTYSIHRYLLMLFPIGGWIAYSRRPAWMKWAWLGVAAALHFLVFLPRYLEGALV